MAGAARFIPNFYTSRGKPLSTLPRSICNLISRRNAAHTAAKRGGGPNAWKKFRALRNRAVCKVRRWKCERQQGPSLAICQTPRISGPTTTHPRPITAVFHLQLQTAPALRPHLRARPTCSMPPLSRISPVGRLYQLNQHSRQTLQAYLL